MGRAQKHFAYAHNIRYVMLCYVKRATTFRFLFGSVHFRDREIASLMIEYNCRNRPITFIPTMKAAVFSDRVSVRVILLA